MPQCALVERLRPGDHVCWTFDDDRARDAVVAAYVRGGVRENHKTLYLPYSDPPERVLARLTDDGIPADELVADGQLEVLGADETYLRGGGFDAVAVTELWRAAVEDAHDRGFQGIRMAGDGTWAAGPVAGAEGMARYEAEANHLYTDGYAMGLCLYDRRVFPADRLADIRVQHPAAVDPGTDGRWEPLMRIRTLPGGTGLRLSGETDLSNRGALLAALDRLGPGPGGAPGVLDVTGLVFADVAAAHAVVQAAARVGALRVVGASAQLARLLSFVGADRVPGLTVDAPGPLRAHA